MVATPDSPSNEPMESAVVLLTKTSPLVDDSAASVLDRDVDVAVAGTADRIGSTQRQIVGHDVGHFRR